jgi:hypothetical protein
MSMSTNVVTQKRGIGKGTIVAILMLVLLIAVALHVYFHHGGGTSPTQPTPKPPTTTSPGPSPPPNVLYPNGDLANGFNVILVEDHVEVNNGQYSIVATAVGSYRSLVAYGGSSVTGNITYGVAVIKYGGYEVPIIGFASTNATIKQDFPGIQVRLDDNGGYVLYVPISMAVYYRHLQYNISNTVVHVWVPAKTQPTTLASASAHVVIDPQYGVYYLNGVAYPLDYDTPPRQYKGILRSWLVYTANSGRYVFTINP